VVNIRERRSLPAEQLAQVNGLRREYRDTMARVDRSGLRTRGLSSGGSQARRDGDRLDMINGLPHWFKPRDEEDLDRVADLYSRAALALLSGWRPTA